MKICIPFEQFKIDFLTQMKSQSYTYDTIKTYRYPLDRFFKFLTKENINEIQNVSESDIDKYRLSLVEDNLKSASMEVYLRTIILFFRYLENAGIIFHNPTADLKIPKADRKMQYVPTVKEMERFLDIDVSTRPRLRNRAMFETAYSCGARLNELRMVDIKDLDLINEELKLMGKGNKERLVPLGKTAIYWLNKYITEARPQLVKDKNEQALFLTKNGNRISKIGIQKHMEYVRSVTKTKVTMHSIRRACATHLLNNGASPMVIQQLLGHSSLRHLSHYLAVTITDLKKMHEKSVVGK